MVNIISVESVNLVTNLILKIELLSVLIRIWFTNRSIEQRISTLLYANELHEKS